MKTYGQGFYVKRSNDKMQQKDTFICSSEMIIGNRVFSHVRVEEASEVGDGY
jgi:hypothetical protein